MVSPPTRPCSTAVATAAVELTDYGLRTDGITVEQDFADGLPVIAAGGIADHRGLVAALALGATRYEMIRQAVLPFGRSGIVSASMLGLGRALGETVAVMMIVSALNGSEGWNFSIFKGGETFASKIANNAGEFDNPSKTGAFIAAGLVLFILTFVVNAIARVVIERRKAFTE